MTLIQAFTIALMAFALGYAAGWADSQGESVRGSPLHEEWHRGRTETCRVLTESTS